MSERIGLGMRIENVAEFNRRAAMAIRATDSNGYALVLSRKITFGGTLDAKEQQDFINLVHSYRAQVHDSMVREYAALNSKGHDA